MRENIYIWEETIKLRFEFDTALRSIRKKCKRLEKENRNLANQLQQIKEKNNA